jgi:hypothetical protein
MSSSSLCPPPRVYPQFENSISDLYRKGDRFKGKGEKEEEKRVEE